MSVEKYRKSMSDDVLHSWAKGAQAELDSLRDKAQAFDWLSKQRWFERENFGGVRTFLTTERYESNPFEGVDLLECTKAAIKAHSSESES